MKITGSENVQYMNEKKEAFPFNIDVKLASHCQETYKLQL